MTYLKQSEENSIFKQHYQVFSVAFLGLPIIGHCIDLAKMENSYLTLINITNSYDAILLSDTGKITIDIKELHCALLTVAFTKVASKPGEGLDYWFFSWIQKQKLKKTFLCRRQDPLVLNFVHDKLKLQIK